MHYAGFTNNANLHNLNVEELAAVTVRAIEDWLDEDTVEFKADEG